jgi:hypothetical protein
MESNVSLKSSQEICMKQQKEVEIGYTYAAEPAYPHGHL